jgi:hypothetical protein
MARRKDPAAVALARKRMKSMTAEQRQEVARRGGLVGGKARAAKMTKAQRVASARKAAKARWAKKTGSEESVRKRK